MAKAKVGGTKSKLRGVVGDVIYQIAKNPYGNYEQRIISYTAEKLNRNTRQQCLARMQIAMFQRCMSSLTPIIKCSYQGIKTGVTSVNEFVSLNMKMVQDFCIDHWKYGGGFSFPTKGREWESFGEFIISSGTYKVPSQFSFRYGRFPYRAPIYSIDLSKVGVRMYDLRKLLRFSYNDTINFLLWIGSPDDKIFGLALAAVSLNRQFGDYKAITPSNVSQVFNCAPSLWNFTNSQNKKIELNASFNASTKVLTLSPNVYYEGIYEWIPANVALFSYIFSHKKGRIYERNTNILRAPLVLSDDDEWGTHPFEAYYSWDANYDGEDYEDYFV